MYLAGSAADALRSCLLAHAGPPYLPVIHQCGGLALGKPAGRSTLLAAQIHSDIINAAGVPGEPDLRFSPEFRGLPCLREWPLETGSAVGPCDIASTTR
jgi:hypothetical protein